MSKKKYRQSIEKEGKSTVRVELKNMLSKPESHAA
jgi:hypothetical protein